MTVVCKSAMSRSIFLVPMLAALGAMPAQGAITLLVDTNAKTFTWSGTATSDSFVVLYGDSRYFRLGTGSWNGGTSTENGNGGISASLNVVSGSSTSLLGAFNPGQFVMASMENSLYTDLGFVTKTFSSGFPGDDTATVTLTITGSGQAYSYASSLPGEQAFLESLDGTGLYFQTSTGPVPLNFGSAAGEIVVVPEPSSALLAMTAPLALLRRRRGTMA